VTGNQAAILFRHVVQQQIFPVGHEVQVELAGDPGCRQDIKMVCDPGGKIPVDSTCNGGTAAFLYMQEKHPVPNDAVSLSVYTP
jgi:hypothetical protein